VTDAFAALAHDAARVDKFVERYGNPTMHFALAQRQAILDRRIRDAGLSLADKIESFRRLAPAGRWTPERDELRMERLLCSVESHELGLLKFALEYDGDYKDLEEYLCHDIDHQGSRDRVVRHLRSAPSAGGIKVLTDVDDTMYPNLVDARYPRHEGKRALYPGVVEFYDALKREPFAVDAVPVTTLSARPNPVMGFSEEGSLGQIVLHSGGRLRPSALSGELRSSCIGTLQTFVRAELAALAARIPHGEEDQIGRVKFENFANFAAVYPDYRYVFVGDSGQADALTAQLMLAANLSDAASRVITTFIHDLRAAPDDRRAMSNAFVHLPSQLMIDRNLHSGMGRGVIVFRNYIDAASTAFALRDSLDDLITPSSLARITHAALVQFSNLDFIAADKRASRERLRVEYLADAGRAYELLSAEKDRGAFAADLEAIRVALGHLRPH
jgi:hypothetical protein